MSWSWRRRNVEISEALWSYSVMNEADISTYFGLKDALITTFCGLNSAWTSRENYQKRLQGHNESGECFCESLYRLSKRIYPYYEKAQFEFELLGKFLSGLRREIRRILLTNGDPIYLKQCLGRAKSSQRFTLVVRRHDVLENNKIYPNNPVLASIKTRN